MKKRISMIVLSMVCTMMVLCACGKEVPKEFDKFVGTWQCGESPIEHEEYYTGFLVLKVEEDTSFRMYDAEAGNPGISGKMDMVSDTEILLICSEEEDFDPAPTWDSMEMEENFTYEFVSENELHLTFEGDEITSTLVFTKQNN